MLVYQRVKQLQSDPLVTLIDSKLPQDLVQEYEMYENDS